MCNLTLLIDTKQYRLSLTRFSHFLIFFNFTVPSCTLIQKETPMKIETEKVAYIHYTLKDVDNEVIDSSENEEPLAYIHGIGNMVPGLEEELEGKVKGDSFNVTVPPEKGYGLYQEQFVQVLPISQFGDNEVLEGMQFHAETANGVQIITVTKVENGMVTVDGNHQLAGETLHFEGTVMDVREATSEELDHGHVHGPGGHEH